MSEKENKEISAPGSYRLKGEELKQFEKKVAESGMSRAEFCRRMVLAVKEDKGH